MSLLAKIQAAKSPARSGVVEVPESTRIVEIPRRDYEGADLNAELRKRGGTLSLFPIQSEALAAARDANGLVAPMAVGEGKTFPALLVGSVLGARLALVLTKAKLVRQTRDADRLVRQHFRVTCTNRVASYASLSRGDFLEELVEHLDPSELVVVCDEAHCLANPSSARTRRVIRFAREYPAVRWVMLTGTFLRKSIKDAAHLAELALRERSPYPAAGVFGTRKTAHLEALAECLDVHGRPSPEDWLLASPLASFAGVDLRALRGAARQSAIRAAFAERVRSAPGVVCSRGERVAASLELVPVTLDTPADVLDALDTLRARSEDPDGEIHVDDMSKARKARELAAGFYYRWIWPDPDAPDLEWLEARRDWFRTVRAEIDSRAARGYDSPALVAAQVAEELASGLPKHRRRAIHGAWERWQAHAHKPEPDTVPVWISDYLVRDAVAFARSLKSPPVIWWQSRAVGEKLAELGVKVYGAGEEPPETPAHLCGASISAHGTGRNLQAWREAIIVEPPAGPWEQLLGRHHRRGQTADEVTIYHYNHVEPFQRALASAMEAERFAAESESSRRRLLYADKAKEIRR